MHNVVPIQQTPQSPPSLPRLALKIDEAAQVLGLNHFSVRRLIARGKLKCSSALRHKLVPVSEIERFLKETSE